MSAPPTATPSELPSIARGPALSPSRAKDFKQCPLKYRLRAIDRIPETPTRDAVRGTAVHAVLESLYGLPSGEREPERAAALVEPAWQQLLRDRPEFEEVLGTDGPAPFLAEVADLVHRYYRLENPTGFDPQSCESLVEVRLADGSPLRGYVDRIDVAADGRLRVVDYKTGRTPGPDAEQQALFQLKFYALVVYRSRGVVPAELRLLYLRDGQILTYTPDVDELVRFERIVSALWEAITTAGRDGDFPARRGGGCRFCEYQPLCPAFGGTTPPYPGWPGQGGDPAPAA